MPRTIPPERFDALVRAACATFIAHGYRLTQMADVASRMGLGKATLYGYVGAASTPGESTTSSITPRPPVPGWSIAP